MCLGTSERVKHFVVRKEPKTIAYPFRLRLVNNHFSSGVALPALTYFNYG